MGQNSSFKIYVTLKVLQQKFEYIFALQSDKIKTTYNHQKIGLLVQKTFLIVKFPFDMDIIPKYF